MPRALPVLLTVATLAAGCTPAEQGGSVPLGPSPTLDGGTFSTGGGITVAAELRGIGGQTALCGVWAESDNQSVLSKGRAGGVMGTGSVYLGDQVLHRGLGFMRKVDPMADYAGQQAACVITARPWVPGDDTLVPRIRIPRQTVHREIEDDGSTSVEVIFRQTGPGA